LRRPLPSFTIDTVRSLKQEGVNPVYWLIGADQVPQLPRWHQFPQLLMETEFVIMDRPGAQWRRALRAPEFASMKYVAVPITPRDISATDIRRRVASSQSISGLVPQSVARYISERRLYIPQ
ncbi:MAG: nicotinate-nucleotide adenylyltransferase, partial [Phycisphaerae bacterium]|nr:nicotinate-nucleotide adenylyltransferase [Phycisphaerae bacterium]